MVALSAAVSARTAGYVFNTNCRIPLYMKSTASEPSTHFPASYALSASGSRTRSRRSVAIRCKEEIKDTRIHYSSTSTEGWIGGSNSSSSKRLGNSADGSLFRVGNEMLPLLLAAPESHYKYLGVSPDANVEEIKAAYRRLTKLYHPDTTTLPIEVAAQKFMRLKEAHSVLTSIEKRRYYDWQLAQTVSMEEFDRFTWPSELNRNRNPNDTRATRDKVQSDDVPLSDQAMTALVFDLFALLVAVIVIIYVAFFKNR